MKDFVVSLFSLLTVSVFWNSCEGQSMAELRKANITGVRPTDINSPEAQTGLSMDQIIVRAMGGIEVAAQSMVSPGGMILAELDMLLTEEQFSTLYEPPEYGDLREMPFFEHRRKRRKAVRQLDLRWAEGVMPYYFADGHFSDKEKYLIKVAMREWEKYSCVKFREKTRSDRNYVRFQNGMGCNSQLGMVGGMQVLNLDVNGCRWKGLYLHEIGHALGLVHEHQLPNRDEYIEIMYSNVEPSMRIWFNKYSGQEVNQYDVTYEYSSVMHYGITAFSSDGKSQTIKAKDKSKEETIGKVWRKELSFSDVKAINRLYRCGERCPSNIRCRDGGFVDQNCRCICPDGSQNCQEGQPAIGTDAEQDDTCTNMYDEWACNVWASQGECKANKKFMLTSCRKACKLCGDDAESDEGDHVMTWAWMWLGTFANLFPRNWSIAECTDKFPPAKCQKWESLGDCVTSEEWMTENCRKTCNMCSKRQAEFDATTNCRNLYDNSEKCDGWAKKGECGINPLWMTENCRKSCRLCHKLTTEQPPQKDDSGDNNDDEDTEEEEEDRSGRTARSCRDLHDTRKCKKWADKNECAVNPDWMIPNCRKSCDRCVGGSCRNYHDDTECDRWSSRAECIKNPSWMRRNCAKACHSCNEMDMGVFDDDEEQDEDDEKDDVDTTDTQNDRDTNVGRRRDNQDDEDTVTSTDDAECIDERQECEAWARHEHCDINPDYMLKSCKKACGVCQNTREDTNVGHTTTVAGRDDRSHNDDETIVNDGGSRDRNTNTNTCEDDNQDCDSWKRSGACDSNPSYALRHCKKSCNNCKDGCRDEHTLCPIWGRGKSCTSNPGYMLRFCQKTCTVCQ
ncbi:uncharacterized protein LOC143066999 isoform X2 [Mytilus galloprovincialis]|uniref:uncharacterized protein LOC143066999 isoform X2 n=1 Tax=Mytilus galloprovincialis TaxID=29158 RepID=UPI003F7BD3D9